MVANLLSDSFANPDTQKSENECQCEIERKHGIIARAEQREAFVGEGAEGRKTATKTCGQEQSRVGAPS